MLGCRPTIGYCPRSHRCRKTSLSEVPSDFKLNDSFAPKVVIQ